MGKVKEETAEVDEGATVDALDPPVEVEDVGPTVGADGVDVGDDGVEVEAVGAEAPPPVLEVEVVERTS